VQLWLVVEDGKVQRAGYETHGCPSSVAASSVLCTLLTGMAVETAMTITQQDLLTVLGGLPEGKERFAGMAVEALHHGLERAN
jgi:NifU-like protein involved in Fe-S cluster formation